MSISLIPTTSPASPCSWGQPRATEPSHEKREEEGEEAEEGDEGVETDE